MSLAPGQINLPFQIAVLIVILAAYVLRRMKKLLYHGITMAVAALMSLFSFLIVMLPSAVGLVGEFIPTHSFNYLSLAIVVHIALGITTGILALRILAAWRFRPTVQYCTKLRRTMRATLVIWLTTLAMGVMVYLFLYRFLPW